MKLTREFWEQLLQLNQDLQRKKKRMHHTTIVKHFGCSVHMAKCLFYALQNRNIIIPREMDSGERKFKRVGVFSDTHCGHIAGLTPPTYQLNLQHPRFSNFAKFQNEIWKWFNNEIEKLKPFDVALWNGDLIDGKGIKSGGTELITPDRNIQANMASEIISLVGANKNVITYGTAYHTGQNEDFEEVVANEIDAEAIKSELNFDINGVILNAKHHISNSTSPYGHGTPLLKDQLFQMLRAEQEEQTKADIVIRSHIHNYIRIDNRNGTALITPALQGSMTKYGTRRCVQLVDFGFIYIDIYSGREYYIYPRIMKPRSQVNELIKLM